MKKLSLVLRTIFLFLIVLALVDSQPSKALFYTIIFSVPLIFVFLARYDEQFWIVDSLYLLLFLVELVLMKLSGHGLAASWLGVDKLFHLAAGAISGYAGFLLYRKKVKKKTLLYLHAVLFAVFVGGGWEVYEWFTLPKEMIPYYDTIIDMITVTLGSILTLIIIEIKKITR